MVYLEWNDRLAATFFRSDLAGRPVHLYVTEELVTKVGASFGGTLDDFIASVKAGPPWATRTGLCQRAYQSFENWRARELQYPPYIAYLGLFVLAAGAEGDFASHAYYPRLRNIIGAQSGSTLPGFEHMRDLWADLERWSNHDEHGELGVFSTHTAGSWVHVGLPIAQTILTEHEQKVLPAIFADARIDSTSPPSDVVLAQLLRRHGAGHLRQRTLALLSRPREEVDLYDVLLETIREELADWDGTVEVSSTQQLPLPPKHYGNLRLCASLDKVARSVRMSFRCKVNHDFPDGQLYLKTPRSAELLSCEAFLSGWSTQLVSGENGTLVDASGYLWEQGVELVDDRLGWQFRLQGSSIRIFVKGAREGLPGLVEVHELPRSFPFYLATEEEHCVRLRDWAESSCEAFQEIENIRGLPAGWRFFSSAGASSDTAVRDLFPALSFSNAVRLSLLGGVRSSRGNDFFDFAPPEVILEGGDGSETITCNGRNLTANLESGSYVLPAGLPSNTELSIQVQRGAEVVKRRTIFLVNDFDWRWSGQVKVFGNFGQVANPSSSEQGEAAGANVAGIDVSNCDFALPPEAFEGREVYLLGYAPGQIVSWPKEPLPDTWSTVWAIPAKRRRGRAIFCGRSISGSVPITALTNDRKRIKLWKAILRYWGRRIALPSQPAVQTLWKQFQEAARRVR